MTIVLGIDPGLDGALVVLQQTPIGWRCVAQHLTADLCPHGYLPEQMDTAVSTIIMEHRPIVAVLERVSSRPGEGVSSAFKFGVGWGLWRGILAGRIGHVLEPAPAKWTRVVLRDIPGEGKARAIARAAQLPGLNLTPGRRRKAHDGLADAACLALYGGEQRGS